MDKNINAPLSHRCSVIALFTFFFKLQLNWHTLQASIFIATTAVSLRLIQQQPSEILITKGKATVLTSWPTECAYVYQHS